MKGSDFFKRLRTATATLSEMDAPEPKSITNPPTPSCRRNCRGCHCCGPIRRPNSEINNSEPEEVNGLASLIKLSP